MRRDFLASVFVGHYFTFMIARLSAPMRWIGAHSRLEPRVRTSIEQRFVYGFHV